MISKRRGRRRKGVPGEDEVEEADLYLLHNLDGSTQKTYQPPFKDLLQDFPKSTASSSSSSSSSSISSAATAAANLNTRHLPKRKSKSKRLSLKDGDDDDDDDDDGEEAYPSSSKYNRTGSIHGGNRFSFKSSASASYPLTSGNTAFIPSASSSWSETIKYRPEQTSFSSKIGGAEKQQSAPASNSAKNSLPPTETFSNYDQGDRNSSYRSPPQNFAAASSYSSSKAFSHALPSQKKQRGSGASAESFHSNAKESCRNIMPSSVNLNPLSAASAENPYAPTSNYFGGIHYYSPFKKENGNGDNGVNSNSRSGRSSSNGQHFVPSYPRPSSSFNRVDCFTDPDPAPPFPSENFAYQGSDAKQTTNAHLVREMDAFPKSSSYPPMSHLQPAQGAAAQSASSSFPPYSSFVSFPRTGPPSSSGGMGAGSADGIAKGSIASLVANSEAGSGAGHFSNFHQGSSGSYLAPISSIPTNSRAGSPPPLPNSAFATVASASSEDSISATAAAAEIKKLRAENDALKKQFTESLMYQRSDVERLTSEISIARKAFEECPIPACICSPNGKIMKSNNSLTRWLGIMSIDTSKSFLGKI